MNTILQDPLQRKSSRKLELPSTTKGLSTKGCICRTPFETVLQGENYPNKIEGTFYQSPPHLRNSNGSLFQAHYSLGSKNQNKRNWKLKILATNDLRSYDSKCFLVKEYFTFPSNFRQNSDLHSLVDHIHGTFHLLGGLLEPVLQHNQLALCGHPDPVPNIITYQHTIPNFEKEHTHNPNISAKCKLWGKNNPTWGRQNSSLPKDKPKKLRKRVHTRPSISWRAAAASASDLKLINPKPRDRPVSRSQIIFTATQPQLREFRNLPSKCTPPPNHGGNINILE